MATPDGTGMGLTLGARAQKNSMLVIGFVFMVALAPAAVPTVQAQPHKPYRVGLIHPEGPYAATVEGFKDELRTLGLEPAKDIFLEIRDQSLGGTDHDRFNR